ncbi:hypothetical protein NKDENANG_02807 [Candidatus Entotheonellaceae bacterium PAL068K]
MYHFAGTEHSLGNWPPTAVAETGDGANRSQNWRGVVDYAPLLRACWVALEEWVTQGIFSLPNRHPRIDESTAVPPAALKPVFDRIPGANYPARHALPRRRDYGLKASREQVVILPPSVGPPPVLLKSRV